MPEDAEEVQRETTASDLLRRDSRGLLHWVSCSESKKDNQGQGKRKNWEVEAEINKVLEADPEQSFSQEYHPFREQ